MSDDDATMNPKVEMEPKVEWLGVVGEVDTWRSLGLSVTDDGMISLVGTSIRLVAGVADVASESAGIESIGTLPREKITPLPSRVKLSAPRSAISNPTGASVAATILRVVISLFLAGTSDA